MLKKYLHDTSGNFATVFAISAMTMIVGVGAAIDYSGMTRHSSHMQNLTDAAVIAAVSSGEEKTSKLRKIARQSVLANNQLGTKVRVSLKVLDDDTVRVTGQANYNTQLMRVVGRKTVRISTVSEAPIPRQTPYNIALVLDKTYSMKGANMTALKSASQSLTKTLDSFEEGSVNVAVVPFSTYVNVGTKNRLKKWMDVPVDTADPRVYTHQDLLHTKHCKREKYTKYNDGVPSTAYRWVDCKPQAYGPKHTHAYVSKQKWYGCAGSRSGTLNEKPQYDGKKIPGIMNNVCGSDEILPLTSKMKDVDKTIQGLSAQGYTYMPGGLMWGWRMLDEKQPFDDASNVEKNRQKAIVLMTDGENTVRLSAPNHWQVKPTHHKYKDYVKETNDLTASICDDIKAEGIEIFTVAYNFGAGSKEAKNLVKNCATSSSMFFDAANASELEEAFERIGNSLYRVRLSK